METLQSAARIDEADCDENDVSRSDGVIVGRVETSAALLGQIFVRTSRGVLVRVTTTPLTVLRSRRRRGLAWSETKFVRLQDVRDGDRIMVKGSSAENGTALRAHVILAGDIARFAWCTVRSIGVAGRDLVITPFEGSPMIVDLLPGAVVRELASTRGALATRRRDARTAAALDENEIQRLSHDVPLSTIAEGDTVLALIEPKPSLGAACVVKLVRIPTVTPERLR